jgi:uncharacterized repeat protein (TIGR03803 family)
MRSNKLSFGSLISLLCTVTALIATTPAAAQTETVLYSFSGNTGSTPASALISDGAGNLYGTTVGGGAHALGTVFELSPATGGGYTETVLHSFGRADGSDGISPYAGLVRDSAGNLYGTTNAGGSDHNGIVFELSPTSGSSWTEKILYVFQGQTPDECSPRTTLLLDSAGNLYGTTSWCGSSDKGTIFELTPKTGGLWQSKLLFAFNGTNGYFPFSLVLDAFGNLYGATAYGGANGVGTVFELKPVNGVWKEHVLHDFDNNGVDGANPQAGLIFDSKGNLYGTTQLGGANGYGTVFELSPAARGAWTETILHNFTNTGGDGYYPEAPLIFDIAGNLYGTTTRGGSNGFNGGTVFELTPDGSVWNETVLHSFGSSEDGSLVFSGLLLDGSGNLYGTTETGGAVTKPAGTVFQLTP